VNQVGELDKLLTHHSSQNKGTFCLPLYSHKGAAQLLLYYIVNSHEPKVHQNYASDSLQKLQVIYEAILVNKFGNQYLIFF